MKQERPFSLSHLISDEQAKMSAARVGLWITVTLALATVAIDLWLTWHGSKVSVPNTVYALEGTMFTVFAAWAAGPRIAEYIGPQIGAVAAGLGAANREKPPYPDMDHHEDGP